MVPALNISILVAFALNTALTFLSITGAYGHTNSELSKKYQTLVTPAGWTFSIWGIIFTLEGIFALAQMLPSCRGKEEVRRGGLYFILACIFQAGWSVTFGMERIYVSQVLIVLIWIALWKMNIELKHISTLEPPHPLSYALWYLPFVIHLGWLTAASVVSINLSIVKALPSSHALLLALAICSLLVVFIPTLVNPASGHIDSDIAYILTISWALAGVASQVGRPLQGAPYADPISDWCPEFVLQALSAAATTLSVAALVLAVCRALKLVYSMMCARGCAGKKSESCDTIIGISDASHVYTKR